jgi:hypothetical protein
LGRGEEAGEGEEELGLPNAPEHIHLAPASKARPLLATRTERITADLAAPVVEELVQAWILGAMSSDCRVGRAWMVRHAVQHWPSPRAVEPRSISLAPRFTS